MSIRERSRDLLRWDVLKRVVVALLVAPLAVIPVVLFFGVATSVAMVALDTHFIYQFGDFPIYMMVGLPLGYVVTIVLGPLTFVVLSLMNNDKPIVFAAVGGILVALIPAMNIKDLLRFGISSEDVLMILCGIAVAYVFGRIVKRPG